ncbi:hypothetical protein [Halomonas sp. BC04]|uniref:hypothetical protein n=1 Tax=Halomonas sp. BC04 TaxID=1403540 RepID=UPI0003ED777F|nr:hypothetical protein [Halomonas sp. BC04]EWG99902.1 hypothetical protein Q427_22365 [Halomonas sp. BC04]
MPSPYSSEAYRAAYRAQAVQRIERKEAEDKRQEEAGQDRQRQVAARLDPATIYARQNRPAADIQEAAEHLDENTRRAYETDPEQAAVTTFEKLQEGRTYAGIYARHSRQGVRS